MIQRTAFLPGLSHQLCGRQRRSQLDQWRAQTQRVRQASLSRLSEIFRPWLPSDLLPPNVRGLNSRKRLYPLELTFWAFLSQVLSPGSSCREIVRKVQAWYAPQDGAGPDSRIGAYCQARARLPLAQFKATHEHLAQKLAGQATASDHWSGRRVNVIDGTGLSMPDTAANQEVWPQPNTQKPGCGFPVVKLAACFCLASGALLHWVQGTLRDHDCRLLQRLMDCFQKGDVVLADRGFSSFANLAVLLARGVDSVMRLHHFRKLDWRSGRRLGPRDRVVRGSKGPFQGKLWTHAQWEELPAHLDVRVVEIQVEVPGFRTHQVVLLTVSLDSLMTVDDEEKPTTIEAKVSAASVALGGTATGFKASGSAKASGINSRKMEGEVEFVVGSALGGLMADMVVPQMLK